MLPVAWPFRDYGNFASGGVSLGNMNLELIRFKSGGAPVGVAFEPVSLPDLAGDLDARKVEHGKANPVHMKDGAGKDQLAWTTVQLEGLAPTAVIHGFFCQYHFFDVDRVRAELNGKLRQAGGGPLGIERVAEIVLEVGDAALGRSAWAALLGAPQTRDQATWQLGGGPALRIVEGSEDKVTVRIQVSSLEKARAFLKADGAGEIGLKVSLPRRVELILVR
jgi:hypothetical protein